MPANGTGDKVIFMLINLFILLLQGQGHFIYLHFQFGLVKRGKELQKKQKYSNNNNKNNS